MPRLCVCVVPSIIVLVAGGGEGVYAAANEGGTPLVSPAPPSFVPYRVEWSPAENALADASGLLHRPAGKHGFVEVRNGHFYFPNGQRFKMWGVNSRPVPKDEARDVAKRLSQLGINCVRLHYADCFSQRGGDAFIDMAQDHTQDLDVGYMDKFDYFVHCLKEHGIYLWIQLQGGRTFKPGDEVKDHDLLPFSSPVYLFDPQCVALRKQLAEKLLSHVNSYSGRAYRDDPAVAIVEIINENNLNGAWLMKNSLLAGQGTKANTQIDKLTLWADIPVHYGRELDRLYQAYLAETLGERFDSFPDRLGLSGGQPVPRLTPREFAEADKERLGLEAGFYVQLERRLFNDFRDYLQDQVGVRCPIVATSEHNSHRAGGLLLSALADFEVIDKHFYYNHSIAMVDRPFESSVAGIARAKVANKPLVISETNADVSPLHRPETIPLLAAYASLHDWDGIFWFTLAMPRKPDERYVQRYVYGIVGVPTQETQLLCGANLFLGGHVSAAKTTVQVSYTKRQLVDSLITGGNSFRLPGFPMETVLRHRTEIRSFDAATPAKYPTPQGSGPEADRVRADTGELTWSFSRRQPGSGVVVIETEKTQGLIGYCDSDGWSPTANLEVRCANTFASILLTSMDDQPLSTSRKMLLSTCARAGAMPGSPAIEPVTGTIRLRQLGAGKQLIVHALDGAGKSRERIRVVKDDGEWVFEIGNPAVPWYVIETN